MTMSLDRQGAMARLRVADDGPGIPLDEQLVISAQLRQVQIAEWSDESPVKHQDHILLSIIV